MTNSLLLEDADLSSDILVLPASSAQDTLDFTISDLSAGNSRLGLKISKYFESLTPFNVRASQFSVVSRTGGETFCRNGRSRVVTIHVGGEADSLEGGRRGEGQLWQALHHRQVHRHTPALRDLAGLGPGEGLGSLGLVLRFDEGESFPGTTQSQARERTGEFLIFSFGELKFNNLLELIQSDWFKSSNLNVKLSIRDSYIPG